MSARKIGPLKISVDYDHTDECYVGHVEADERTEACDDRDEAEAAAEAELRKMHDALREHFDPVPVLRWTQVSDSAHEARFVVDPSSSLAKWGLRADCNRHYVSYDRRSLERDPYEGPHTVEDHKRAAVAALRALGVAFRVEGA